MDKHFLIMKPELLVQLSSFSNGGEKKNKPLKCSERCSFVACRKVLELSTQLLMQWKLI